MSDRDDFGSFLAGLVIGGIAGSIFALLYTPQSGEETRTMIKEKAIEIRDNASGKIEETIDKVEKAKNEAATHTEELLHKAQKSASDFAEKGQILLEKQKGKLAKTRKASQTEKDAS